MHQSPYIAAGAVTRSWAVRARFVLYDSSTLERSTKLGTWSPLLGVSGILAIQALVSFAIIDYFMTTAKDAAHPLKTLVAPVIAARDQIYAVYLLMDEPRDARGIGRAVHHRTAVDRARGLHRRHRCWRSTTAAPTRAATRASGASCMKTRRSRTLRRRSDTPRARTAWGQSRAAGRDRPAARPAAIGGAFDVARRPAAAARTMQPPPASRPTPMPRGQARAASRRARAIARLRGRLERHAFFLAAGRRPAQRRLPAPGSASARDHRRAPPAAWASTRPTATAARGPCRPSTSPARRRHRGASSAAISSTTSASAAQPPRA